MLLDAISLLVASPKAFLTMDNAGYCRVRPFKNHKFMQCTYVSEEKHQISMRFLFFNFQQLLARKERASDRLGWRKFQRKTARIETKPLRKRKCPRLPQEVLPLCSNHLGRAKKLNSKAISAAFNTREPGKLALTLRSTPLKTTQQPASKHQKLIINEERSASSRLQVPFAEADSLKPEKDLSGTDYKHWLRGMWTWCQTTSWNDSSQITDRHQYWLGLSKKGFPSHHLAIAHKV